MSIVEKLNSPNLKLSKSDHRVLDYIKKNGLNACSAAISEIARSCDVSHATVTRFARKFGFDTLRSFKIALAKELGSDDNQGTFIDSIISNDESCADTSMKLLQINISTLKQTLKDLDLEAVNAVARNISTARRIFFIGIGNSGFAAEDSAYKFARIGIDARAITDSHAIQIQSTLIKPDDLVIAFSNSGTTKEMIYAVNTALHNRSTVVAITSQGGSPLHDLANLVLLYAVRESIIESGSINSKLAVFYIVDLLFAEVIKILGKKAIVTKQKTAMALNL